MKNGSMFLLATVALVCTGCATGPKNATHASNHDNPDQQILERHLLDKVLSDLAVWDVFSNKGSTIVVHDITRKRTETLDEKVLVAGRKVEKLPRDIQADIVNRNLHQMTLTSWRPSSPAIRVTDLSPSITTRRFKSVRALRARFPDAKGFVHSWRPGFSADGRSALVRLRFGEARAGKGGVANYFLQRDEDAWTIKWKMVTTSKLPW